MRIAIVLLQALFFVLPAAATQIPITTTSPEAREDYLAGRALFEKLRGQDARPFLEAAIAADSNFAMAWLGLSQTATSTKDFFDSVDRAASLVEHVSAAERLWIEGFHAGIQGHPQTRFERYSELAASYPDDPRAHNLLGTHYFGQQNWTAAAAAFEQATQLDPTFSLPYNMLGYALRFAGDFTGAEAAFQTYIELIPDDPNPYDSYAELLMKMGRFEESIASYRQALEQDGHFIASHLGIATSLNFLGRQPEARQQLQQMLAGARNDGERRGAFFAMAVSHLSEGNTGAAISNIAVEMAFANKIGDAVALAGDHTNMGLLCYEAGQYDAAEAHYAAALAVVEASDREEDVKDGWRRGDLYNRGTLAVARGDVAGARELATQLRSESRAINNLFGERLSYQLEGMIELSVEDGDAASQALAQANQQNPQNLYRQALAAQLRGDRQATAQWLQRTLDNNPLNNLNDSLVRARARQMLDQLR